MARAPARSGSLTCCCKGISESSLAPGEVGGRLERGPEAEWSGGAGRGRAPWGGWGREREGGGAGCEGAGTVPGLGAGEQEEVGAPSPPPAPPPAGASSPVTGASSAHVCETSPAGPGEKGQILAAGREPGCPRPPSPGGGEGDRAGKEGARGEAGQGQARGPVSKAPALRPRGRRRCHRGDAPRPEHPPARPLSQTARALVHRGSQLHLPHSDTRPPPRSPLLPGARSPKVPGTGAPALGARLRDPRPPRGCRGRRQACTPRVPRFTSSGVPHSPVHYSLPHPLLHPGRDPFLRPRKRKLRVAREGRVGVGKSAGKEGGARKVLECWMWLAKRDSPPPRAPAQAPMSSQRPQGSTPSLTISTRWRDSNEAHDAQPRAPAPPLPGARLPPGLRTLRRVLPVGHRRRRVLLLVAAVAARLCWRVLVAWCRGGCWRPAPCRGHWGEGGRRPGRRFGGRWHRTWWKGSW